jgi:hypothetical protein
MTHSHDRTLLASLGFADPDKREPLHDLACEYLSQTPQSERIARLVEPGVVSVESRTEVAILKGDGQYRTTIGFLDLRIDWVGKIKNGFVIVEVKINRVTVGEMIRQINLYREYAEQSGRSGTVALSSSLDASVFRQRLRDLGASRTPEESAGNSSKSSSMYVGSSCVVATAFDLDPGQIDTLQHENIRAIRLGEGFEKWFEERQKRSSSKVEQF